MSERVRIAIDRQTSQATSTLGRTVRELVRRRVDPSPLLAKVERACREALAETDEPEQRRAA